MDEKEVDGMEVEPQEPGKVIVRSIRASQSVFKKFTKIAEDEFPGAGGGQGRCLSELIRVWEAENAKHILVDEAERIDSFRAHLDSVNKIFLDILESKNDTEMRIRGAFEGLLSSKDLNIVEYQKQIEAYKASEKAYKEEREQLAARAMQSEKDLSFMEKQFAKEKETMESTIEDKEKLVRALQNANTQYEEKVLSLEEEVAANEEKVAAFSNLFAQNADNEAHIRVLEKQLGERESDVKAYEAAAEKKAVAYDKLSKAAEELKDKLTEKEKEKNALDNEYQRELIKKEKELLKQYNQEVKNLHDSYAVNLQSRKMTDKAEEK